MTVMDKSVDMIAAIRRLSHFYRCAHLPFSLPVTASLDLRRISTRSTTRGQR